MWNPVHSLLICDVIQEKESMYFNKTCYFSDKIHYSFTFPPVKRGYTQLK